MHEMQQTPKIITIIGLVFEGLAAVVCGLSTIGLALLERIPGYSESILEMPADELEAYELVMGFTFGLLIVFTIIFSVMFVVNLILFTKLMKGAYTEEQAKKVYLYQAIWGGISVLINSVTGILYLISGIQGYNGRVDRIDTREGI